MYCFPGPSAVPSVCFRGLYRLQRCAMPKLRFSNNVQVQKILETRDIDEAPTHLTTTLSELPEFIEDLESWFLVKRMSWTLGEGGQIIKVGLLATLTKFVPIGSMYGTFAYIYHKNQPNVGKYTSPMDPMGYKFPRSSTWEGDGRDSWKSGSLPGGTDSVEDFRVFFQNPEGIPGTPEPLWVDSDLNLINYMVIDNSRYLLSQNVRFSEFMFYNDPHLEISGMLFLTKCGSLAMMFKDPRAVVSLPNWWCCAWHEKSSALTAFPPSWLGCLAGHQSLTFGRTGCDVGIPPPWRRLHLRAHPQGTSSFGSSTWRCWRCGSSQ